MIVLLLLKKRLVLNLSGKLLCGSIPDLHISYLCKNSRFKITIWLVRSPTTCVNFTMKNKHSKIQYRLQCVQLLHTTTTENTLFSLISYIFRGDQTNTSFSMTWFKNPSFKKIILRILFTSSSAFSSLFSTSLTY